MPWFFLSFWRIFSLTVGFGIKHSFLSTLKNCWNPSFWHSFGWWEDYCYSDCFFFIGKMAFLIQLLSVFFVFVALVFVFPFSLVLRSLTIMFLMWVCLGLSSSESFNFLNMCISVFGQIWKVFYHFTMDYFCCFLFFFPIWKSNDQMLDLLL